MATAPVLALINPLKDRGDEALERLIDCRQQKHYVRIDIEECYYFAAPRRLRTASSQNTPSNAPTGDADELQTSLGFEVAEDFMTMLIDSFMPQSAKWAERRPDPFLPDPVKQQLKRLVDPQDDKIFEMIRGSNFHAELAKQGVPDGAVGVIAMLIRQKRPDLPLQCIAVPIREIEMNIGPDGRIDDRFIVRRTKYRSVKALLPGIPLPPEIERKIKENRNEQATVTWGWWRNWSNDADEAWHHVVLIDDVAVHRADMVGQGSCELVIGRFNASPDFAWPEGPMIRSLPDLRQLDETRAAFVENHDFTLRPPFAYDDDGVLNFEDGIEPGMGYPRRPGPTRNTMEKIWQPNPLDAAMFDTVQLERRIKRMHYVDFPEQDGKTPPTATQWLDEMVEAQKKIGTPGYNFWREFPYDAFARFLYLAETNGKAQPIKINGQPLSLQAYNPATRSQDNQDVLTATRFLQIANSAFPQVSQVAINPIDTMNNIKGKLGDKLVVVNSQEDLKKAVTDISGIIGNAGVRNPAAPGGLPATTQ